MHRRGEELVEVYTNRHNSVSSFILFVGVKFWLQAVSIEQYILDIEQWLSGSVESLLSTEQHFQLSQLVDYDVQLVEVYRAV